MNPHSYIHLILTKAPKTYNGEKTASSTKSDTRGWTRFFPAAGM
jgi:hypothetical protein